MLRRTRSLLVCLALPGALALGACEGPTGAKGDPGENGAAGRDGQNGDDGENGVSCTLEANGDGTATITCADGTTVTVNDGADGVDGLDGDSCTVTDNGDGTKTVTCGDASVIVTDGTDGSDAEGHVPLEPNGVVGKVADAAGDLLTSGTVYFVPAADVAALPATVVEVGSTNDEPLEDVIAAEGAGYPQAIVGEDGRYALPALAEGSWFITFVPGADDDGHHPGGSLCRTARNSADIVGTRLDIEVSAAIPSYSSYVGSGVCTTCHGRSHITETMHRVGIWSPYEYGPLQDTGQDALWAALDEKFSAGTTIYFYDYDANRKFDKYKTSETDPNTGTVSFTVTVREGGRGYEMLLHNVVNAADPDVVISLDAVYGGGVGKQRYLTRIENALGTYMTTMPLQYNSNGEDSAIYPRTGKQWRDYHGDWWFNEGSRTFRTPAPRTSFEKNCISCHAAGVQVTGSDDTIWTADVVTDRTWGDFDFDGDGMADEMNIGCETCHGPGSAHWDSAGQGRYIVSPSLLTPEREAVICGQCHSRPQGALGTDAPVNADGLMMIAGTSRNDFLTSYATTQLDGAATDFHADPAQHSKSHHQQYSDFIRSPMYKNATQLMTCSTCHNPHERENSHQLRNDPAANDATCGGAAGGACHATQADDVSAHLDTVLGAGAGGIHQAAAPTCVNCHMAKTSSSGSGEPGLVIDGVQYWQGDISSHLFDVPDRALSRDISMPTPYTRACGVCHVAF